MRRVFEVYTKLCRRDGMLQPLSSTEFRDVLGSLETLSLVASAADVGMGMNTPARKQRSRAFGPPTSAEDKQLVSCMGEAELARAVEGVAGGILKGILDGSGLD